MSKWIIEKSPVMECSVFEEDLNFPLRNVYCVGRNYRDHAIEMGSNPDRDPPFFFQKTSDIILKDGGILKYPIDTSSLHYEVELVVFISKNAFQIKASEAKNIIFGYSVGVDITKRDIQKVAKDSGKPWFSGKVFNGSAVLSNIIPISKSLEPDKIRISLRVNGEKKQESGCNKMIWNIYELISILSESIPLKAGDVIFSGTPAGVGKLKKDDSVLATLHQPNASSLSFKIS